MGWFERNLDRLAKIVLAVVLVAAVYFLLRRFL